MKKKNIVYILVILLFLAFFSVVINEKDENDNDNENDNDLYAVVVKAPMMKEQFTLGNIDGCLIHHPTAAEIVAGDNSASYLVHSSELWPNHSCCILTSKTKDDDVNMALTWAHVKATEFINDKKNRDKVIEYAQDFTGLDEDIIKESIEHILYVEYPNRKGIEEFYSKLENEDFFVKKIEELGYETEEIFFNDLFERKYYDYVKENPSWKPEIIEKKVSIGYFSANLHHLAAHIAKEEGYYDSVFSNLEMISFSEGNKVMDAYKANLLDASYIGVPPVLTRRINENIEIKIIGGANEEGSALIVKNDIQSLDQLVGKRIGIIGLGTMPDFLLRMVAEKAKINFHLQK
jgi:NitT/TauT family transport system substrate-binding protein